MKAKNIRGIFVGYRGQRIFNYLYSIGASIVILGAMFKLLHVPYADPILILGMGTEAVIFFLSAFDEPAKDYKWERVFSELEEEESEGHHLSEIAAGVGSVTPSVGVTPSSGSGPTGSTVIIGGGIPAVAPEVVRETPATLPADLQVSEASEATSEYVKQLTEINESLAKLQASLSQNIQGLNAMYELQLRDVGSQLQSVSRVHSETEQMAKTIAQLNVIYEKMLAAMQKN